jgi:hypothetical protein
MSSPEVYHDIEQGSDRWFGVRMGIPTASSFHTVLAKGKEGGRSITRDDYMRKLAGEILTEEPAPEGYSNGFMDRGKLLEPDARAMFAFIHDVEPEIVGFVRNGRKGASPDSLIGTDGGLEIKTAIPAVQVGRLQGNRVPPEYVAQVQGSLWVSERDHWWFMSYCPKLPPLILRVGRDDTYIAKLSAAVDAFNDELDSLVNSIRGVEQFRKVAA